MAPAHFEDKMPAEPDPKLQPPEPSGCLTLLIGGILGYFVAFAWSCSQVRLIGSQPMPTEYQTQTNMAFGFFGVIMGGLIFTIIAHIRHKIRNRRRTPANTNEGPDNQ